MRWNQILFKRESTEILRLIMVNKIIIAVLYSSYPQVQIIPRIILLLKIVYLMLQHSPVSTAERKTCENKL